NNTAVKDELKLTEQKIGELAKLSQDITARAQEIVDQKLDDAALNKLVAESRAAFEKKTLELLEPGQRKRLAQIQAQQGHAGKPLLALYTGPDLVKALDLKPEHVAKLQAVEAERLKALEGLFVAAERYDELVPQLQQFAKKAREQFHGTLTKDQLAR